MGYLNYEERLRRHRILVNNGINDPVIADRMATVGYTPEKMQQARVQFQELEGAYQVNNSEQQEYDDARRQRREAKDAFHDAYIRDLDFARIALRNDPHLLSRIGASGTREKGQAKYLEQARNFYSSLATDPSLMEKMAVFGYNDVLISDRLTDLDNLFALMEEVEREEGDTQHQTKIRDQKFDEFDDWASIYKQVARLMFEDDPQYLEKLGIVVKS